MIDTRVTWKVVSNLIALAAILVATCPMPAAAEEVAYRYWAYWTVQDGSWQLAEQSPEERTFVDQSVDGWHFGVWGDDGGSAPRSVTSFAALCPKLAAVTPRSGQVRVAVVLDPGINADAPSGESPGIIGTSCLTLPAAANGRSALSRASSDVRVKNGTICAINGYPVTECGPQVAGPTPSTASSTTAESSEDFSSLTPTEGPPSDAAQEQRAIWKQRGPVIMAALGALLLITGASVALSRKPKRKKRRP